jgi:RNA chaperone Hfq
MSVNYKFVQEAIDGKQDAVVFLVNGVSLRGKILDQDVDSIVMECTAESSKTKRQLVYKEAISTVST